MLMHAHDSRTKEELGLTSETAGGIRELAPLYRQPSHASEASSTVPPLHQPDAFTYTGIKVRFLDWSRGGCRPGSNHGTRARHPRPYDGGHVLPAGRPDRRRPKSGPGKGQAAGD